jgi:hypothetical protein
MERNKTIKVKIKAESKGSKAAGKGIKSNGKGKPRYPPLKSIIMISNQEKPTIRQGNTGLLKV